jgi:hypothetical protein
MTPGARQMPARAAGSVTPTGQTMSGPRIFFQLSHLLGDLLEAISFGLDDGVVDRSNSVRRELSTLT